MEPLNVSESLAELVLEHAGLAEVLRRHRLDYSVKGHLTLAEACHLKGLPSEAVLSDLERARAAPAATKPDPRTMSPATLMFYIVSRHHAFLREALPVAEGLAIQCERGQPHRPMLGQLRGVVHQLRALLEPHIDHEEQVLFPSLLENTLTAAEVAKEAADSAEDHRATSALLTKVRDLTAAFTPVVDEAKPVRALYFHLAGIEADTLEHVHVENYVLFPRLHAARKTKSSPNNAP